MNKSYHVLLIDPFFVDFFLSVHTSTKDFTYSKGGDIWFRNPGIELQLDSKMNLAIYYKNEDIPLNFVDLTDKTKPSHFITVNGKDISDFTVNYDDIKMEQIESSFGTGRKLMVKGVAEPESGLQIEKILSIELYDKYPDAAIITATYKNTGTTEFTVDKTISNYFKLDASVFNSQNKPYDFWSYQGASLAWGFDYVIPIKDGFQQRNWMGVQPETKTGGGVPLGRSLE